jgi:hypothetical protein
MPANSGIHLEGIGLAVFKGDNLAVKGGPNPVPRYLRGSIDSRRVLELSRSGDLTAMKCFGHGLGEWIAVAVGHGFRRGRAESHRPPCPQGRPRVATRWREEPLGQLGRGSRSRHGDG